MVGSFHCITKKRNSSPPFSALGACHAVRILLRIQPRSGYYLCHLTFPYIYYVSSTGYIFFFNRGFLSIFFPSISRLSTTPQFSPLYYTQPSYLRCFVFPFLYAVHQHLPSHRPVRKTTPDKTHDFEWHMFQLDVAPRPLGTVHYLPLLLSLNNIVLIRRVRTRIIDF